MKAVAIQAFGSPEGLAVIEIPAPAPASGQVLIATEAIGVGGVDVVIRRGALAAYGFKEGHIPGGEVAGTVTAVGDDVDTSWVGQRVWAFTGVGGGYVEQATAPVGEILRLPADLSAADAVTLGSSGVVAHFGLSHARFAPGEPAAQARLLCVLAAQPRGMAELSGILGVEKAAVTGLVDRVERRGLAERKAVPGDRRALRVTLTTAGERAATAVHDEVSGEVSCSPQT